MDQRLDFEDLIGRLLLRSDVCYAGRAYCIALAGLNTPGAVDFLQQYLRYYLLRKDLAFDQANALAALKYLDEMNGTTHSSAFEELWHEFASSNPKWNLARACSFFNASMRSVEAFRSGTELLSALGSRQGIQMAVD